MVISCSESASAMCDVRYALWAHVSLFTVPFRFVRIALFAGPSSTRPIDLGKPCAFLCEHFFVRILFSLSLCRRLETNSFFFVCLFRWQLGYCLLHGKLSRVQMNKLCEETILVHSLVHWLSGRRITKLNCVLLPAAVASRILAARCGAIFDADKFVTRMCCVLQFNLIEI